MKTTTATSLRKELFGVLERAVHSIPTRVRYKKKDAVIISYEQYKSLRHKKKPLKGKKRLVSLVRGRILKPLDESADEELMRYMGL